MVIFLHRRGVLGVLQHPKKKDGKAKIKVLFVATE